MERRLGRGLGTLLQTSVDDGGVRQLDVSAITPNPLQPRTTMDPAALEELRDSIRMHGILQPVVVRRHGDHYQLVAGERRWRAARLAGLSTIPAVVREDVSDSEMLELALIENVQRHDQNAIERALGFKALMETLGLTQEAVAAKVGLRRSSVANHVRLLELPQPVQDAIAKGLVTMGHARALLGMEDSAGMLDLLEQTVRQELSVRDVERLVRAGSKTAAPTVPSAAVESAVPPAWLAAVETRFAKPWRPRCRFEHPRVAAARSRSSSTRAQT